MRALRPDEWAFAGLVFVAVAWIGYEFATRDNGNADLTQPPKQPAPEDSDAAARLGILNGLDGHSVVCMPAEHHAGYVYATHRYPRTVGGEITNVIHRGFTSMRVPDVTDAQWIISPPSEAQW